MATDTWRRDLVLGLLALLGAGLFALNTGGYAGNGALVAAELAMILPLLFKVDAPGPVVRPAASAGRSLSWRIALVLCGALTLWQIVMGRVGSQRLGLGLFLSVGMAAQALGFFQRAAATRTA